MKPETPAENLPRHHLLLFGAMEILLPKGKRIPLEGKIVGELLAYLLLHSETPLQKTEVVKCFWQESDPVSARTRLRQELPKLRALFPQDNSETEAADTVPLFHATHKTIQLNRELFDSDVQQFQVCLEKAKNADTPAERLALLQQATVLYRADLLTEYDDWVIPLRAEYRARYNQALQDIATAKQEISAASLAQLRAETSAEDAEIESHSPFVPVRQNPSSRRFAGVALPMLFLFVIGRYLWRPKTTAELSSKPPVSPSQPAQPPLESGKEKWVYTYKPEAGEKPNSEAKAVIADGVGNLYATGLIQVSKGKGVKDDNTDILTVKLSKDGKKLYAKRYSSPEGDCDRAFSITLSGEYVYVAGETYVPEAAGVQGGWRIVLLCYDKNLKFRWAQRSPMRAINHDGKIRAIYGKNGNVIVAGTGIRNQQEQIVLLSYNPNGKLLWHKYIASSPTQNTKLSALQILTEDRYLVSGTATIGEGKPELDTDWITAQVNGTDGKIQWLRLRDGSKHGSDFSVSAMRDRFGTGYVGGVFSLPTAQGSQYAFGVIQYDGNGQRIWQKEILFPQGKNIVGGAMTVFDLDGTVTAAAVQVEPGKSYTPIVAQYSMKGLKHWQREFQPTTAYIRQDLFLLYPFDAAERICACGTLASALNPSVVIDPHIWTVFLDADGCTARQYVYPSLEAGMAVPNDLLAQSDSFFIAGQNGYDTATPSFLVLKYQVDWKWK